MYIRNSRNYINWPGECQHLLWKSLAGFGWLKAFVFHLGIADRGVLDCVRVRACVSCLAMPLVSRFLFCGRVGRREGSHPLEFESMAPCLVVAYCSSGRQKEWFNERRSLKPFQFFGWGFCLGRLIRLSRRKLLKCTADQRDRRAHV